MRILITQPTGDKRGHYGLYTAKVCQALAEQGHQVTLCTNRISTDRYLRRAPKFRIAEVGGGRLDFAPYDDALPHRPWRFFWGYLRHCYAVTAAAIRLCHREHFDAVLVLDTEFLIAAAMLRRARGLLPPVAMAVWASNFTFGTYYGSLIRRVYKVLQREVFRSALGREIKALVVLTDWHRATLRRQLRLGERFPIVVVPDGGEVHDDLPPREAARGRLGLPSQVTIFLFFGMLRRDKGIEYLIAAATKLPSSRVLVLLAGSPMQYSSEEIVSLTRSAGVADRIEPRLGYVPDAEVPWYFAACDALVLPYTRAYTGGSGPLIKGACSYGRPVIVTDVAEMGRLVREHGLGLVARPEDAQSLAEECVRFMALGDTPRRQMEERALAVARANSWAALAVRYGDVFRAIANGDPIVRVGAPAHRGVPR